MPFTLADLPYAKSALEPFIDATTMEIHHGKHHKAYVDNANKALEGTAFASLSGEEVVKKLSELPDGIRMAVRNNAGGHVNHTMFWQIMKPHNGGGAMPSGELADVIKASFSSFEGFKERFTDAAMKRFGSGWAWLCVRGGKLEICSTANQDTPLMGESVAGCGGTPILGIDVWEHAYYLKYQNRRAEYIGAWWNVVNWPEVARRYAAAK